MMITQVMKDPRDPFVVLDVPPQTAQSILNALQDAIDERVLAQVALGDYPARKLAILELVKLQSVPDGSQKRSRMLSLIEEFGLEDVERWQSAIDRCGR